MMHGDTPMSALVAEYLAFRRGLGFKLRVAGWLLRDFARYAEVTGHEGPITLDIATRWATTSSGQPPTIGQRLSVVRQFARYRAIYDPRTEIPPAGYVGCPIRRRSPHIYSDAEIAKLLEASARLSPRRGLRSHTYMAFFSLLACTGLRAGEARSLSVGDVDLDASLLIIRESKFRKSRLVPLHPTAVTMLGEYAALRDGRPAVLSSAYFFRTDRAACLKKEAVESTFDTLRSRLGWTAEGRARRPRIHDLRHTFAVRRLLRWYQEGADVEQKLLRLATYLGHARVTDTYWYLNAVPELLAIAARRFETFANGAGEEVE